jgi:hypothetical protein
MPSKSDLLELARICLKQASLAKNRVLTATLKRLAKEYQYRAAQLDGLKQARRRTRRSSSPPPSDTERT